MATGESLITTSSPRENLIQELRDHAYRRAFVQAHVGDSIAFQLKAMRLAQCMEQRDVAALLGNPKLQPMISRYENPDYGKYSVNTLLELADAFDVALIVHFAPFSELVDWDENPSSDRLCPPSFDRDEGLWGEGATSTSMLVLDTETSLSGHDLEADGGPVSTMGLAASETQESINVASEATVMEEAA